LFLGRCLDDTGEPGKSLRTAVILGAMRKLAHNNRRSQCPLPTVVGWFDRRIVQEQKHPPSIMLQTDPVQEPLVVLVLQNARAQVYREFCLNPFDLGLELLGLSGPLVAPELAGFSKDAL